MVHYDEKRAEQYNSGRRLGHPLHMLPYETWKRLLGDVAGLTVLDLACGDGYTSRVLAGMSAKVVGIDISPNQIERARQFERDNPLGIEYIVADAAELNLLRTFDLISPSFLFHYASDKAILRRMVEKSAAHLKHGGRMVALAAAPDPIVPRLPGASHSTRWGAGMPEQEGSEIILDFYDLQGEKFGDIRYYYWAPGTYEALLREAGFVDIRWHSHTIPAELHDQFPNWKQMERQCGSAILTAMRK